MRRSLGRCGSSGIAGIGVGRLRRRSRLFGSSGKPRWGEWKLRLPVDRFDTLLADLKKLAEVRSAHTTSDDVSEEYYDVDARIRNKQQEETRLLRLLDDRTAKLD